MRGIGQTVLLDKADELGLLYYEEPGGYKTGGNTRDVSLQALNRERFLRMMKRDRSHPSLIIYNMINEISNRQPLPFEIEDLKLFHSQDETRHITYTSSNFFKVLHGGKCPVTPSPVKSFR
jgi:beta-galactosidase/beta-glucuronidase